MIDETNPVITEIAQTAYLCYQAAIIMESKEVGSVLPPWEALPEGVKESFTSAAVGIGEIYQAAGIALE